MSDRCQELLLLLVREVGMTRVLESLIKTVPDTDEQYINRLRNDLKQTLKNYCNRYEPHIYPKDWVK